MPRQAPVWAVSEGDCVHDSVTPSRGASPTPMEVVPHPSGRRVWLVLAAVVGAIVLHGALFWIDHVPQARQPFGDEEMYFHKASKMAADEPWTPARFWPLFHARALATVMALGGGALTIQILQTLVLLVAAWVVGQLAAELTGSPIAAGAAMALMLLDPQVVSFAHFYWPEVNHLALFFGAWLILLRKPAPEGWQIGWLVLAGLLLGLALLTKNHMAFFIPVLLLLPLRPSGQATIGQRALRGAAVALPLLLTVFAANTVFAKPLAPRDQFVSSALFNVWVGFEDVSRRSFEDEVVPAAMNAYTRSGRNAQERNSFLHQQIASHLAEQGVVLATLQRLGRQFFRLFHRDSFLTDQLPGGLIVQSREKGYVDASPAVAGALRLWSYAIYTFVLVAAAVGVAVLPARGRAWLWLVGAFMAYNALLFLAVHVKSRYRVQLMPFFYIYAGVAFAWLCARCGWAPGEVEMWRQPTTRSRWALAVVGVALLLFFAWS